MAVAPSPSDEMTDSTVQGERVGDVAPPLPVTARRHQLVHELQQQLARIFSAAGADEPVGAAGARAIVVGVSGGADSTALLAGLRAMAARRSALHVRLVPVYVHHHLRACADEDEAWLRRLCERLGLSLRVEHVHPARERGNRSASARRLRYAALVKVAREESCRFVAVAHHADDQLETMLMAMCRGTGVRGLRGMAMTQAIASGVSLIRSLLAVRRADCESFCNAAELPWREDPSNVDATRARARLRQLVMPELERMWPGAAGRAADSASVIRAAATALDAEVERLFGTAETSRWPRESFAELSTALITAGLRRAALHQSPKTGDRLSHVMLLRAAEAIVSDDRSPRSFAWPGKLVLHVTSREVRLQRASASS